MDPFCLGERGGEEEEEEREEGRKEGRKEGRLAFKREHKKQRKDVFPQGRVSKNSRSSQPASQPAHMQPSMQACKVLFSLWVPLSSVPRARPRRRRTGKRVDSHACPRTSFPFLLGWQAATVDLSHSLSLSYPKHSHTPPVVCVYIIYIGRNCIGCCFIATNGQ